MNLRKAAQQALEALELAGMSHDVMLMSDPPQDAWKARGVYWKLAEAIEALRAALAETTSQESRQVEPVAWMVYTLDGQSAFVTDNPADFTPEHRALPLYTAPPKHKPLTDEQICDIFISHGRDKETFARAVERAHGIGGEE